MKEFDMELARGDSTLSKCEHPDLDTIVTAHMRLRRAVAMAIKCLPCEFINGHTHAPHCEKCKLRDVYEGKRVPEKYVLLEQATRALSFDEMLNKIAPILDGTPNAHAKAEKIITALFGERP